MRSSVNWKCNCLHAVCPSDSHHRFLIERIAIPFLVYYAWFVFTWNRVVPPPPNLHVHPVCTVVNGNSIVHSALCSSRSLQVDLIHVFVEMKEGERRGCSFQLHCVSSMCDRKVQWGEGDASYGACRPSLLRAPSLFLKPTKSSTINLEVADDHVCHIHTSRQVLKDTTREDVHASPDSLSTRFSFVLIVELFFFSFQFTTGYKNRNMPS